MKKTSEWHLKLWWIVLLITLVAMLQHDVRADVVTQISVIEETEIATEIADSGPNSVSQKSGDNGDVVIRIKFSILNSTLSEVSQQVADTMENEVDAVMRSNLAYFKEASFFMFKFESLHTIVYLDLKFNQVLEEEQLDEVRKILYELIEVQNTIKNFWVDNLLISEQSGGRMYTYNYCNISGTCPSGARCIDGVDTCSATCDNNKGFCLNRGTCKQSGQVIKCDCPKRFNGTRCELSKGAFSDSVWIALIAVVGIVALLLLLILLFCLCKRCNSQKRSDREIYGVENVIGLQAVSDEMASVGGVAIQTDDSFLLNLTYGNGVPPKSGYSHKIMQTNDSFLLARSQNPRVSPVKKVQSHSNGSTPNESSRPGTSEGNARGENKETATLPSGGNSQPRTVSSTNPTSEVKTPGSPRNIMTV